MSILDDAREGMDLSIRPQDDLFGHVNGRWLDSAQIPSDRASWGAFDVLRDSAESAVHRIIEEVAATGAAPGSEAQKIGDLYASFMDTDAVNAAGADPIRATLAAIDALTSVADLARFLGDFQRGGGSGIFASYVDNDDRNADRYIVNLVQAGIGLPDRSYYSDEKFAEIRSAYVAFLTTIFELVDYPEPAVAAESVMDTETQIAAGHWDRVASRDVQKTYNLTTLTDLTAQTPAFEWATWIDAISGGSKSGEVILAETCVRQPSFFSHLDGLLTSIDLESWKTYLASKAIRGAAPYLSDEFVVANFDFYGRTLSGTPQLRERWKRGVALVEGVLGEAVAKEYVARHFPPSSKAMMDDLVVNLLAAYRASIASLDWMGEETKQKAYAKLDTFRPKIGYPENFRDYSDLQITPGDLIGNVWASSAFETDRELNKIGAPVDRDEWFMLPQTVNAYYNPGTNEICFPAGILQKPFFDPEADLAENYGGIGGVIGHEIGHGFDDQGAQFDPYGNLMDWWTADDLAAFEEKSAALIAQYDGFEPRELPGEHVNGGLTVGENIGDLGGLTIALRAFGIALGGEASLEERRTLFLNWGYIWRTKRRKETQMQYLTVDPHSPPEFRANIVRNLDEFHEVFDTAEGDGLWLDPADRVRIW
ncbi:M13 family metallopeptidase [soil metagenome]